MGAGSCSRSQALAWERACQLEGWDCNNSS